MAEDERVQVAIDGVRAWQIDLADDGQGMVLMIKTDKAVSGFGFVPSDAANFVGSFIAQAEKFAQTHAAAMDDGLNLLSHPIPVQTVGIHGGRHPEEALLSMRLGSLTMTFAIEAAILHQVCTLALAQLRRSEEPAPKLS